MNNLCDLRDFLTTRSVKVLEHQGWWLETIIGRFTIAQDQLFCDGEPMSKKQLQEIADLVGKRILTPKEVKEMRDGKPQTWEGKEPTRRMPDVQAAQG
jgi:hypothetical protein